MNNENNEAMNEEITQEAAPKKKDKRGWVKNVAIIFLAVMLALTFFSNTILNWSLPQVDGTYAGYGSIATAVRGTGTVTANMGYNVQLEGSREIKTVHIKNGDTVEAGQLLFTLEESDSTELQEAKKQLETLQYDYQAKVLQIATSSYAQQKQEIANIEEDLAAAIAARNQISIYQAAYDKAKAATKEANARLETATDNMTTIETMIANIESGTDSSLSSLKRAADKAQSDYDALLAQPDADANALAAAKADADAAKERYETASANLKANYENSLAAAKAEKKAAENYYADCQAAETEAAAKCTLTVEQANENIEALTRQKEFAVIALDELMKTDNTQSKVTQLELARDRQAIADQQEVVNKLGGKGESSEVTAKYAGMITAINCIAGDTVAAGDALATIDVEGKGYTASFSVTNEQSKQVHVGDKGTVSNYWGGNLEITLAAIKTDQANPGKGKLLEFDITGDVTAGQSLDISVGERQTSYDKVVPNNAVREDSDGKFILIAAVKSTPLGNRYTATRVDITVIAKDGYNSAIDCGTDSGYDYVITTSTKPLQAGMQVRLVENK